MSDDTWTLYARSSSSERLGVLEEYTKATLVPRFNQVGDWRIEGVPTALALALEANTAGNGIEVVRNDQTVFSGPMRKWTDDLDSDGEAMTLEGVDDTVMLSWRVAHPDPAATGPTGSPPVYAGAVRDVRTGVLSTLMREYVNVNAGPGAIVARRIPGLTIGPDPLIGDSHTLGIRWANLLDWIRFIAVAGGGIGFRVRDLVFEVFAPVDRTSEIVFSAELGTLQSSRFAQTLGDTSYVYVGGTGEGIARIIVENELVSLSGDGQRMERFIDRRDSGNVGELSAAGGQALFEATARYGFEITPIDAEGRRFGVDYNVGDLVSAVINPYGIVGQSVVTAATVTIDAGGVVAVPVLGDLGVLAPTSIYQRLADLERRSLNLESR